MDVYASELKMIIERCDEDGLDMLTRTLAGQMKEVLVWSDLDLSDEDDCRLYAAARAKLRAAGYGPAAIELALGAALFAAYRAAQAIDPADLAA